MQQEPKSRGAEEAGTKWNFLPVQMRSETEAGGGGRVWGVFLFSPGTACQTKTTYKASERNSWTAEHKTRITN